MRSLSLTFHLGAALLSLPLIAGPALAADHGSPAASARATDAPASAAPQTYRFDIPEGPLDAAIGVFETVTGRKVVVSPGLTLRAFTSAGVSGVQTAEQALERLLAGTGLSLRTLAGGAYALDIQIAPEHVEVTGRIIPYRVDDSATATRTSTLLRDIPQTLTVVPRQLLIDQNAQSVADAVRNVPGVSIAQGEGNRDQVVLRGISTASDFFVNGVRDDQERFRDLYNVQSIEVLQGPAAVLFGRGGAGGVVNLVTKAPVRGAPSDVSFELGSEDRKRGTAQIELPLGPTSAFRVSAMGEDSGGFRSGYFLHRYGINPTVRVDLGGATTLTFGFEHLSDRRLADRGIPSQGGRPVDVGPEQFFGSTTQNEARSGVNSAFATFEHRFGNGMRLRNSALVGQYDKFYQNVYPGSAVSAAGTFSLSGYNHQIDRTNTFHQTDLTYDVRIGGMTHTLLFGVELGHQFQDEWRHTASAIPDVPLSASVRDANFTGAPIAIDRGASSDIFAAYLQDQVTLTPRWKAVVGARTDRFSVIVDDHLPGAPDLTRTDVPTSPRAGLIFQPNDRASIYTSYSYTFLPSGQTLGLAVNTAQLEPENAKNYEAGAKLDLIDHRLSVSAAVFRLDRNNVKNTDPNNPGLLVLTGRQRTDGLSVSAAGNLAPRWTLYGGYAHLDARITEDIAAAPAGRAVGLVPRSQLTLWSTYDISKRWGAGGGLLNHTRMFTAFSNAVELPGFTRVDAVVYYRLKGYRVAVNAENLLNTRYYPTANGDNNISPGAPRNVHVTLSAAF
jgi:catecholate siderophore receptor